MIQRLLFFIRAGFFYMLFQDGEGNRSDLKDLLMEFLQIKGISLLLAICGLQVQKVQISPVIF